VATLSGTTRRGAQGLLSRMVDDGLLKKADGITPPFYHLKSHPKAYNIFNYQHEKIAADIYVYLQPFINYWDFKDQPDFLSVGLKPDRQSIINALPVMWEIDRSTMTRGKIIAKVEKYIRFANKYNRKFRVIFACSNRRAKSLLQVLTQYRHHLVWFYTVDFKELITNPTGEIFNSITLERVPLLEPQSVPKTDLIQ
jgi:uncharacterized protein Usg